MPLRPPRPCSHPGCSRLTTKSKCDIHKKKYGWDKYNYRGTPHERGYGNEWKKIRKHILRRDKYLCVMCFKKNILKDAVEVDHIIPKNNGGKDDYDNLQSLCSKCHRTKTYRERHSSYGRAGKN